MPHSTKNVRPIGRAFKDLTERTMTEKLKFEVRPDKVALITFNNPEKLNAFSNDMLDAYLARLQECGERDDVRAVVVTGAGKGFCSGGDTGGMGAGEVPRTKDVKSGLWDRIQKIPQAVAALDKPVLAAVNGVAVGAGMDMALHADLRYAAKSARFAETYVRMGLVPGNGACWFLPRIVGVQKALELLWTCKFLNADEAKDIGLVCDVFDDDKMLDEVLAIAAKIAAGAPNFRPPDQAPGAAEPIHGPPLQPGHGVLTHDVGAFVR